MVILKHQDRNQNLKLLIGFEYQSIKEKHLIKVIHQIGQKKYLQLIKYNTLIQ